MEQEIEFILSTAALYLAKRPARSDVLSVFAGIRPLVRAQDIGNTAALSRDHTIHIDQTGLLTICGGKWTTYRRMAEDCVNQAATLAQLPDRACPTQQLAIHGAQKGAAEFGHLWVYGRDAPAVLDLKRPAQLHPDLPYTEAEVIWGVRQEMAHTVEDVLARRTRALFLNSRAAVEMAPRVAALMAEELGKDEVWMNSQVASFAQVARAYTI
jgi:glycerol-3-phosphate dehydrogenase